MDSYQCSNFYQTQTHYSVGLGDSGDFTITITDMIVRHVTDSTTIATTAIQPLCIVK